MSMRELRCIKYTTICLSLLLGLSIWRSLPTLHLIELESEDVLPQLQKEDQKVKTVLHDQPRAAEIKIPQIARTKLKKKPTTTIKPEENYCIILVWVPGQSSLDEEWPTEGSVLPGHCKITYFHKFLEQASIVVIYQNCTEGLFPWRMHRDEDQYFIWWSTLNPWKLKQKFEKQMLFYDNFFNWTMTYRRDSDIYFPLWRKSSLYNSIVTGKRAIDSLIAGKTRSSIWIENNCQPSPANKKRMRYAVQLVQAKLKLTLIGNCFISGGKMPTSKTLTKYRFYLSFIDSNGCKDYVTENLWHPLRLGLVPVVFGPSVEDVINVLPHKSFIHASSFDSAKELADHLSYLEQNVSEYRTYFHWRKYPNLNKDDDAIISSYPSVNLVRHNEPSGWTKLCAKFRGATLKPMQSRVKSIRNFVFDKENPECLQT